MIGGIFLCIFTDALLFDMVLNTAYEDGVDTHQDLIDRDMVLGINIELIKLEVSKLIFSYSARKAGCGEQNENLRLRTLQNTRNDDEMFLLFIFH